MSFLQPLMLLGLLAAAVPVAIHLLGRRQAPRRRFAALHFVLRSDRRIARRLRLRQWLLLAVRVLLLVGAALMTAKPVAEAESDLPAFSTAPQSAVLIIDDTLSMRWQAGGQSLHERAKQRALELVDLLGAQAEVAMIGVALTDGPLARLTRDLRLVRRAINRLEPTHRHANLGPALAQARAILTDASLRERHIFVISDFADHGVHDVRPRTSDGPRVHRIDVAAGERLDNRAVVALSARPSSAPGQRSTRISARICNFSAERATVLAKLEIGDQRAGQGRVTLEPWACEDKHFHHVFSRGGSHRTVAWITADALEADDRRYLRVDVQNDVRVLLVNGGPSPILHRDELFYLETALHAGFTSRRIVTTSVTVDEVDRMRFERHDVVALCNVSSLTPASAGALAIFVERGGGLLITLGDQVREDAFNHALQPLLPQLLRGPASARSATSPGGGALRIGLIDTEHPLLAAIWSRREGVGLRSARFLRIFRVEPAPAAGRRVLLRYDDGSPALIERRLGAGRVLLFTSTIDRDWNDLPIRPGYVPLVQQMVRYLSRTLQAGPQPVVQVGDSQEIRIADPPPQVQLVGPDGDERLWSPESLRGRRVLEIVAEKPGFHDLSVRTTRQLRAMPREGFAVNVDPRESDLRRERAGGSQGPVVAASQQRATRRVELWHGAGLALLLFLLLESLLTRRR